MGYFSNGTEGEEYESRYCSRCVHGEDGGAGKCAVWLAHIFYNYDECNNKKSPLHILIPRSKDGLSNLKCLMFREGQAVKRTRKKKPERQLLILDSK